MPCLSHIYGTHLCLSTESDESVLPKTCNSVLDFDLTNSFHLDYNESLYQLQVTVENRALEGVD
jgi:hypothetical protein